MALTVTTIQPRPKPHAPAPPPQVLGLKLAQTASPHNFQLSLALMQGLLCLGAPEAALRLYTGCQIKQVQQETLTFVALPALAQLPGGGAHAAAPLALAARFRRDGMQDMQEALGLALRPVEWAPVHPV